MRKQSAPWQHRPSSSVTTAIVGLPRVPPSREAEEQPPGGAVGAWQGQRLSRLDREGLVPPRGRVRNMSQQNVAVARRWIELFNARDHVDEFLSLHDPEVVLQTPGGPRLRGHDQV